MGFAVTNTEPPESTATHNPSDAQETPVGVAPSSKVLGPDQLSGAAASADDAPAPRAASAAATTASTRSGLRRETRPDAGRTPSVRRAITRLWWAT